MKRIFWLTCALLLTAHISFADYLEVRRNANLYTEPSRTSALIRAAEPGELLPLLADAQTNGYYKVGIRGTSDTGWIYRSLIQRHPGDIPIEETGGELQTVDAGITVSSGPALAWAARHLAYGKPVAVDERIREGYALAHDPRLKIPLWVQYVLTREDLIYERERSDDFRPDPSLRPGARSELDDYRGSGYDRGHLAPAADMKRSETVMSESFLLSNMAPQVGTGMNRGPWKNLEEAVRTWTARTGKLLIITGPIFTPEEHSVQYSTIGDHDVAVPNAFYKIVVDISIPGVEKALAFILPNRDLRPHDYSDPAFRASINQIERLTGLDFLSALPDDREEELEAEIAEQLW